MKLIIFFLLVFSNISGIAGNKLDQKVKVVFRFDDYRLESNIMYDSLLYVFKKNKISICLGIIPYNKKEIIYNNLNQEQLNDLKERINRNDIEIALHGFNHNNNKLMKRSILHNPWPSEFYNLNFMDQFTKIKKGKIALDSIFNINTKIFIPPFNSYNDNTLKALDSLEFEIISANIDGSSSSDKINYIPFTTGDLIELPQILEANRYNNSTVIVMIHPFSFIGRGVDTVKLSTPIYFNQLDTILNWINDQNYIIATNFSMINKREIFDNKRFVLNSSNKNILIKILNKLKIYRYGTYNTAEYVRKFKSIFGILNILFNIIVFICTFFAAKIFIKMIKPFKTLRLIFFSLIFIMILGILYKGINSHSLISFVVLIATISLAFYMGIIRGNQMSKKLGE